MTPLASFMNKPSMEPKTRGRGPPNLPCLSKTAIDGQHTSSLTAMSNPPPPYTRLESSEIDIDEEQWKEVGPMTTGKDKFDPCTRSPTPPINPPLSYSSSLPSFHSQPGSLLRQPVQSIPDIFPVSSPPSSPSSIAESEGFRHQRRLLSPTPSLISTTATDLTLDTNGFSAMATDDQDIDTSTSGKSFEITIYRQAEGDPSNWVPVKIPFTPWDDPDEWTFPSPEMPRCWPEFLKEDRVLQEKYAALYKSHHAWQKACFTEEDETKVIQMEGRFIECFDMTNLRIRCIMDPRVTQ